MNKVYNILKEKIIDEDSLTLSVLLLLSALVVRICVLFQPQIVSNDSMFYVMLAKGIVSGNFEHLSGFSFFSIHPFFLVLIQKAIPDWEIAGRLVSVLFGSLAVIPLFLLFKALVGNRIAFVVGLLYVFGPRFVEYSTDILRESTLWLFSLSALYFGLRGIERKKAFYLIPAGILTGLSVAVKVEGLAVFPIIVLWMCYALITKEIRLKSAVFYIALFILTIPILCLPGLLLVNQESWSWVVGRFMEKFSVLLASSDSPFSVTYAPGALSNVPQSLQSPLELANKYKYVIFPLEIVYKTLKSMTVIPVLLLLAGLFLRKSVSFSRKEIYVIIWLAVFFVVGVGYMRGTYYFGTRHGLLLGIPALVYASIGFLELKNRFMKLIARLSVSQGSMKRISFTISCVLILFLFAQTLITSSREDKMDLKVAGMELKERGYGRSVMFVQSGLQRLAFYADSEFVAMPNTIDPRDITGIMKTNRASILVVDINTISMVAPGFQKSFDVQQYEQIELKKRAKKPSYHLVVYRLKELQ